MNQTLLEEPELLTEVPPILKRLAQTTAYGFYEPEHIAIISLLTVVPCVDEDTLLERLNFDKRQLRQALVRLKIDKLVKQRVVKEKQHDTGTFSVYNFYFINFKVFVNVIKYKLDHIRKKLESEEQQARNRPSFSCTLCENKYSDLEVDRLIDIATGLLKCGFCGGEVEEEMTEKHCSSNKSSLALFNEQMEPLFKLLKACENISLAPQVLEPEPTTVQLKAAANRAHSSSSKGGWSHDKKAIELYDQSISVKVGGTEEKVGVKSATKELPVWIAESTVYNSNSQDVKVPSLPDKDQQFSKDLKHVGDTDILSDLLAHETVAKKPKLEANDGHRGDSEDSEPDSEHTETSPVSAVKSNMSHELRKGDNFVGVDRNDNGNDNNDADGDDDNYEDDDDDDDIDDSDEVMVKVGSEKIPISKVISDHTIMERMTEEEHENYLHLYHKHFEQFY